MSSKSRQIALAYLMAREAVIAAGFAAELDWQESRTVDDVTEQAFLRESAWVILSSGMREAIVRQLFPAVSEAFFGWESAERIARHAGECRTSARRVFGHVGKINAIVAVADTIACRGFEAVWADLRARGPDYLRRFPYLGPATSRHLAKNLGFPTAKPDRHLVRVASHLGYATPAQLCDDIAAVTGHPIGGVDFVLWRYATLDRTYLSSLAAAATGDLGATA